MIKITVSSELITDLFTPGICPRHKCVDGLPKDAKLVDIKHNLPTDTIVYYFDDNKQEVTETVITFESS